MEEDQRLGEIIPAAHLPEDVFEKLKFLNYEKEFCEANGFKVLHKMYFGVPHHNPNEQFYTFSSLVAWLFRLINIRVQAPGQFDDPNATAAGILDNLRKANLPADYPPGKVKTAYGEIVCSVLSSLIDRALEQRGFSIQKPVYLPEESEEEIPEEEGEDTAEIQDNVVAEEPEEDEAYVAPSAAPAKQEKEDVSGANTVIEAPVDLAKWQLELERVGPMLKIRLDADREWRSHLEMTRDLHTGIIQSIPSSTGQLDKIATSLGQAIDSIKSREKYINNQYDSLVDEYRRTKEALVELSRDHQQRADMAGDRTNELARISEELDSIKYEVEERGKSMTETGALVKLKESMKKLNKEIQTLELRIATVSHTLMGVHQKNRAAMSRDENDDDRNSQDDDDIDL